MKKVFRLFGIAALGLLFVTGCTNKDLKKAYDKLKVSDEMNGYSIDCRITGEYNGNRVSYVSRVENYKDSSFRVMMVDDLHTKNEESDSSPKNEELLYVYKDNVLYKVDMEKNSYEKTVAAVLYNNTLAFATPILNAKKVTSLDDENVGDEKYKAYEMTVKKSDVAEMLKYTQLNTFEIEKDIYAKVLIDSEGYLYDIIYDIDKDNNLQLDVSFFGFNLSRDYYNPDIINDKEFPSLN